MYWEILHNGTLQPEMRMHITNLVSLWLKMHGHTLTNAEDTPQTECIPSWLGAPLLYWTNKANAFWIKWDLNRDTQQSSQLTIKHKLNSIFYYTHTTTLLHNTDSKYVLFLCSVFHHYALTNITFSWFYFKKIINSISVHKIMLCFSFK